MQTPERELELYRFLAHLQARLRRARDVDQLLHAVLREACDFFDADAACLTEAEADGDGATIPFSLPPEAPWDRDLLERFLRFERPEFPPGVMAAALRRRRRTWRVVAFRRDAAPFGRDERRALRRVARSVSELVQQIDRERLTEVRSRIERKVIEELRPKDLFYQILHGLRSLTGYDHSSALWIAGEAGDSLELVAEQIAWRKGKSVRIGLRRPMDPALVEAMGTGDVHGFERVDARWCDWTGHHAEALAELLDSDPAHGDGLAEGAMLCAPLPSREGLLGVLVVASRRRGALGPHEAEMVRRFVPQVSVAIQNSRRTETLQDRVIQAEKKNAMAELARGVAHDVNNALGSILPLVQQLRADAVDGRLEPQTLDEDLREIEDSLLVCKRIFGGMLAFARGAARGSGYGDLDRAVRGALAILEDSLQRRGIEHSVTLPQAVPSVACNQGDLEQVLFNLLSNARDAMPSGGRLSVVARAQDSIVHLTVRDTGVGIPAHRLEQVQEPFFTTKPKGNGLGLSICRSIVWGVGGEMTIRSRLDEGTEVTLALPLHEDPVAESAS